MREHGRLTELVERIAVLREEGMNIDFVDIDAWLVKSHAIGHEIAHEQALQFTRIANVLEAMHPATTTFIGQLTSQIEALSRRLDGIEQTLLDVEETANSAIFDINVLTNRIEGVKGEQERAENEVDFLKRAFRESNPTLHP